MVYMATSWNEPQGSPTSLSQELGNVGETNVHTKTDFRGAAKDIGGNERDDYIKAVRDSDIELAPMRPRSFSDVSLSKFHHRKSDKTESDHERKQSMKVIICRESKVITDSGRGRKQSQDKIQYSGSEKPVHLLSRSKSAHGRTNFAGLSEDDDETPPPKPALPKSYRANYFLKQLQNLEPGTSHSGVKHGLDKPEDYCSRSDVPTILAEWKTARLKRDNPQIVADIGKPNNNDLQRTDCKAEDERDLLFKETKSDTKGKVERLSGTREDSLASERNSKVKLTRGRTVFRSESKIALFRSHDAKLRAIALKRELDTLRSSEHVRQRLSSTEHYDVADLKKELDIIRNTDSGKPAGVNAGERNKAHSVSGLKPDHELPGIKHGAKTPAGESKHYDSIKSSNQGPYSRYRNELSSFNNTDRSQNKLAASEWAYPPSGALTEANISRGAVRTNQRSEIVKTKSDNSKQLPNLSLQRRNVRSKSESSLGRKGLDQRYVPKTNDSNHSIDEGDISRGISLAKSLSHLTGQKNNLQEEKSATQIKRKQDTIRKFNYDSIAQVLEKVKSNYQRKPDRNDSESPEYVDIPVPKTVVLDKQLLAEVSDDGASLGDNRSDEEKYAALSRSKILHNKSSSLDSQLEPSRKARQHKKVVHPVIKITSSSSLTDYRSSPIDTSFLLNNTSSSTDSLDVYLSENKGVKHEKFNTDIPPLPKKTINSKAGELKPEEGTIAQGGENTTQQKIVLRQCRIGSDVAFSLIGLKKAEPEVSWQGDL